MDGDHEFASLSGGTCPVCHEAIARKDINVAKPFPCPNCHAFVRTTNVFRLSKYIACYGISALLVWRLQLVWWAGVLVWLAVSFLLGFIYSFLQLMFFPAPTLEVYRNRDFQELDLHK